MDTNSALRFLVEASNKSQRAISQEIGRSPTWLTTTLQRKGSSECSTVSRIAGVCGYSLALVPSDDIPDNAIVIDVS